MKVRCIDNKGVDLTLFKDYETLKDSACEYVVKDDNGFTTHFRKERLAIAEESKEDKINHPSHYCTGKIETIDYIKDKLTKEGYKGYLTGNILKYVSRFEHKNGVEDLKKARNYLDRLIKELENNEHVAKD